MKKRIVAVIFAVLMLLCMASLTSASAAMLGDADLDGELSSADARLALRASVGLDTLTGEAFDAADADLDDGITSADARLILRASVGLEVLEEPHTHSYGEKITTPATCEVKGVKTFTCECGDSYTEEIPASGHKTVTDMPVAPTCTLTGKTEGTHCSVCSKVLKAPEAVPATGHKWNSGAVTTQASCKVKGVKTYTCQYDSAHKKTEELGLDASKHVNTRNTAKQDATCSAKGYTAGVYCNDCAKYISGHTEIAINASAHKWNSGAVTTTATCKVKGVKTYTCQYNSAHKKTEDLGLNASKHVNTKNTAKQDATCSAKGYTAGVYCNDCAKYISGHTEIAINASAHKWNSGAVTTTATCKVKGVKTYTCQHNSAHKKTEDLGLNASNHINTRNDAAVTATCSSVGYTAGKYCKDCKKYISGHTSTGLNSDNHVNTENKAAVPATCSSVGYTAGKYCKDCKIYISGHTVTEIDAAAHKWNDGAVTTTATCKTEGVKTYTCQHNSGHTYTEKLGLNESNHVSSSLDEETVVAQTCTEPGYLGDYKCDACGVVTAEGEEVPASGHKPQLVEAADPFCATNGWIEHYKCSGCEALYKDAQGNVGLTEEDVILEAPGHNFENKHFDASCEDGGYTVDVCKDCNSFGTNFEPDGTRPTGHLEFEEEVISPTCEEDGYTLRTCKACKGEERVNFVTAPGHDYKEDVSKRIDPTCQGNGYMEFICANENCGDVKTEVIDAVACKPSDDLAEVVHGSKNPDGTTAASCRTEYKCEYCKQIVSVVENYGAHRMRAGRYTEAGCTTAETRVMTCRDCGFTNIEYTKDPLGHLCETTIVLPTCTEPGSITAQGYCERCEQNIDADEPVTLPAKGHKLTGVQTCETSVYCEVCEEIDAPALDHSYSKMSTVAGCEVETFFCTRCGKAQSTNAEKIATFNAVTGKIKTDFYGSYDEELRDFPRFASFGKISSQTSYSKFNFGIYTSMIRDMYEEEMANTPDDYTRITTPMVMTSLPLKGVDDVSLLGANDVDSVTVERLSGVDFGSVLSSFDTTFVDGNKEYNLAPYKAIKVDGNVIKVTIDIKNEKYYGGIENLSAQEQTALQNIFGTDVRDDIREFQKDGNGKLYFEDSDNGDGYEMTMKMYINQISTDGKVIYYFLEETYEPIIAVYESNEVMEQDISMNFKIGISIKGTMAPVIRTVNTTAFVFPGYRPQ